MNSFEFQSIMAGPSKENPEKNMSFKLNPTNAVQFMQSIAALCDSKFNPQGLGMVEFTENGFEITVHNSETNAEGKLFLNSSSSSSSSSSSGLIDFHCNIPIFCKMINLTQILENSTDYDDDTITVFHLYDSDHLSFIFEYPNEEVKVELLDIDDDDEFEKLPEMEICCEAVLKSYVLRTMIDHLTNNVPNALVVLEIAKEQATVTVGQKNAWCFAIDKDDENFETRILTEGEKGYHAVFEMKHYEAMKKASAVAPRFHLQCGIEPVGNIMMRFKLEDDVGDLVFFQRTVLDPYPYLDFEQCHSI